MNRIIGRISVCLTLLFISSGMLKAEGSENFSAVCNGDSDNGFLQVIVTIENDSIIIKESAEYQCCAVFALDVSGNIDGVITVTFQDTASAQCDCVCDFDIRINVGLALKSPELITIKYNGKFYKILNYGYQPLVEINKKWNTIRTIPGLDYTYPTYINYSIESNKGLYFCWNGKKYYEVKAVALESNGAVYEDDTITRYIREENGKVYQLDKSGLAYDDCQEYLIYDFTLEEGDTVVVGIDSIPFKVLPINQAEIQGRRCWELIDLSQPELSMSTVWIEGIGDLRGLFKSGQSLGMVGTNNVLTCCSVNDEFIYQESSYSNCGYRPPYQFFIEEEKRWTSVTDCMFSEPSHYVTNEVITASNMVDETFTRLYYPNTSDKGIYYKESDGKIYYNFNDNQYLIYDFTLEEGDSVIVGNPNEMVYKIYVDSADYLTYKDNVLRKTIYLSGDMIMTWIEGIGDVNNPLSYWMPIPLNGCSSELTCCSINNNLIYRDPRFTDCDGSTSIGKDIWNDLSIHPNPSNGLFSISGVEFNPNYDYTVLSSQGNIVQAGVLESEIYINAPNGIYLLIIRQKGELKKTYKLVIDK